MVKCVTWNDREPEELPLFQKSRPAMLDYRVPEYVLYDHPDQESSTLIRLIFEFAAVPYELREVDDDGSEFYGFPLYTLPLLEFNDAQIGSLPTICRHLAWRYDLCGRTASEDAVVDMVGDAVQDARGRLAKWLRIAEYREMDDLHMDELEERARRYIVNYVGPAFEQMLRRAGGEWITGKRVKWADLSLAALLNPIIYHRPSFFDRLPLLYNHCRRVADMECAQGILYNIRERSFKHTSPSWMSPQSLPSTPSSSPSFHSSTSPLHFALANARVVKPMSHQGLVPFLYS